MPAARVCGTPCHLQTLNVPNATRYDRTFAKTPEQDRSLIFTKLPLPLLPNFGYSEYASNGYHSFCELARNATRNIRVVLAASKYAEN